MKAPNQSRYKKKSIDLALKYELFTPSLKIEIKFFPLDSIYSDYNFFFVSNFISSIFGKLTFRAKRRKEVIDIVSCLKFYFTRNENKFRIIFFLILPIRSGEERENVYHRCEMLVEKLAKK